jgi:AcrR family transcriptional regulator
LLQSRDYAQKENWLEEATVARPRGNYAVTEARRLAILEAALQIFGASGYNGSSLKQVAEVVGITEAGILHHFKTKSELLLAVLEYRDNLSTEWFNDSIHNSLAFVSDWMLLLDYNTRHPGIVELYTILSGEATSKSHPAHDYFRERYETVTFFAEANFAGILRDGHLVPGAASPKELATTLIAMSDGLQVQWLLDPSLDIIGLNESFFQRLLTPAAWEWVQQDVKTKSAFDTPGERETAAA